MCKNQNKNNMVTPTKAKQHYKNKAKTPPRGYQGNGHRKNTPSPHFADQSFKSPCTVNKPEVTRCASEPQKMKRRSVTPQAPSSSPSIFAGPKCLEPPTPLSLPKPPTTWTRTEFCPARQALSFEDLVISDPKIDCSSRFALDTGKTEQFNDPLSQQLKMLLKVQ